MLRRPQPSGRRAAAGGEDGAYLCGSLEGWGELKQWPRAQPSGSRLRLKCEHGAYRCCVLPRHGERARCGTGRAAQQCTRRARVHRMRPGSGAPSGGRGWLKLPRPNLANTSVTPVRN